MNDSSNRLVLASTSPRRSMLLKSAGIVFDIVAPTSGELLDHGVTPHDNVASIAVLKGHSVSGRFPGRPVLAADTLVVHNNDILGKPVDKSDAVNMLSRLSGAEHEVMTGVALIHVDRNITWTHVETSIVRFNKVSSSWIESYVKSGIPMDKAGSYAAQGDNSELVAGYEGSFTNIVGLPMEPVIQAFKQFGYLDSKK